ncbi:MAG: DMT family transporter [Candidatus Krumholzibacteriia bacterium]
MKGIPPGPAYMAASALAFSLMALLVKLLGQRLPSQEIVFARALISLVLSYSLLRHAGKRVWGSNRKLLVFRGVLGFGGLSCFYFSVTRLPLAEVTVLHYLHPVLTAILAALFLSESVGLRLYASILLSFAGVILVTKPGFLFAASAAGLATLPTLAALGGAVFSAAAYTVVRRLSRSEDPLVIVFYFPLVAVPASIPTMLRDVVWPHGAEWLVLVGVGIFTQIGQITLTRGLKLEPAGRATAMSYLQVLFAVVWGALFFAESPDAWSILGALLILGGTFLVAVRADGAWFGTALRNMMSVSQNANAARRTAEEAIE